MYMYNHYQYMYDHYTINALFALQYLQSYKSPIVVHALHIHTKTYVQDKLIFTH